MKKLLQHSLSALLLISILSSCSTSSDVVSNKTLQKRKYNKGYYASFGKKQKGLKAQNLNQEENKPKESTDYFAYEEMASLNPIEEKDFLVKPKTKKTDAKAIASTKNEYGKRNHSVFINENNIKEKGIHTNIYTNNALEEDHETDHGFLVILLLIILCFIIPPLAVILYEGPTTRFWLILILSLISVFALISPFAWISGVIAVIWSLLIVIGAV